MPMNYDNIFTRELYGYSKRQKGGVNGIHIKNSTKGFVSEERD